MVFGSGKQTINGFFENENFELILFSEFQNFGEANASPASPVPRPLNWFAYLLFYQLLKDSFEFGARGT